LGAHIDGYIATAAHTIVVGATVDNKVLLTIGAD
jgi:methionine aminopeptidase